MIIKNLFMGNKQKSFYIKSNINMCHLDDFKFLADMIQHVPLTLRVHYMFCCSPIFVKQPFACAMFVKVCTTLCMSMLKIRMYPLFSGECNITSIYVWGYVCFLLHAQKNSLGRKELLLYFLMVCWPYDDDDDDDL